MKIRMKFVKFGSMKFLGHLDVMRYFQKAFRRCDFPVAYSNGYSPHPQMSFASPLGVGLTSEGEYLDVCVTDDYHPEDSQEWIERIQNAMNEELYVTKIIERNEDAKPSMALLAAADYLIWRKETAPKWNGWSDEFVQWGSQASIVVIKKTKKSEKEMDIRPYIYELSSMKDEGQESVAVQLTSGSVLNIKPELLLEEFCRITNREYHSFDFQVHRVDMFQDIQAEKGEIHSNLEKEQRKLVSFGETV